MTERLLLRNYAPATLMARPGRTGYEPRETTIENDKDKLIPGRVIRASWL